MKPSTSQAMIDLIEQIRSVIPLSLTAEDICQDECKNCSLKLVEYLSSVIEDWEYRLENQEIPDFRDLSNLSRSGQKIFCALKKNGLIDIESGA